MIDPELRALLAPPGADSRSMRLRLIRKRGEPLLLLPQNARLARIALGLYPAQTTRARLWRRWLTLAASAGWPLPEVSLDFAGTAPLGRFFAKLEGVSTQTFAVSFGNSRAPGRRFLFLLFDTSGTPRVVVKAGTSQRARELVAAEASFLAALPAGTPGVPAQRGAFSDATLDALAIDFIPGVSPQGGGEEAIESLLTAWLDRSRQVPLQDLAAWRRIATQDASAGSLRVHPALVHGDFAPWNVRVHAGRWTLVDWERGETVGVPGWDWLHYVVQSAVLVERATAIEVRDRINALLRSTAFARYAGAAGFAGSEELIARGYVRYCAEVLRPTERAGVFAELAALIPSPA